jgi:hypothetical protein
MASPLEEGWYLMSTAELEQELARMREPGGDRVPAGAPKLSVEKALAFRAAGNLPDARGRTLRLVLHNDRPGVPGALEARRLLYEPDFHDAPTWRRPGSVPVNVVPVAIGRRAAPAPAAWLDDPSLARLEEHWRATGEVDGVRVPAQVRGFVFKTVLALRAAERPVTAETLGASIARWVPEEDARAIAEALHDANR